MAGKVTLKIDLDADSSQLLKEFKRVENQNKKMESSFDRVSSAAKKITVAFIAFDSVRRAGAFVANTAASFETLNASLTSVYQSQERAARQFDRITKFARDVPLTIEEITEATIKMKSLGLDPSEASIRSFGNTAAAMGKSVMQFTEAVADAVTGEFERLKEFGIKASSEGDRVKLTFQGVTTEIGKNAAEIQQYLIDIGDTAFAGALERQADTINGRMSSLGSSVQELANKFASESGLTGAVKAASKALTDFINKELLAEKTVEDIDKQIESGLKLLNTQGAAKDPEKGGGSILSTGVLPTDPEKVKSQLSDLFRERAELVLKNKQDSIQASEDLLKDEQEKASMLKTIQDQEVAEKQAKRDLDAQKELEAFENRFLRLEESHLTENQLIATKLENELMMIESAAEKDVSTEEKRQKLKKKIIDKYSNQIINNQLRDDKAAEAKKKQHFHTTLSAASAFFGAMAAQSKGFAIAEAITNTWLGVSQSLAAYPMPAAAIFAAAHLVQGLNAVNNIRSGSPSGSTGSSVTGASSSPSNIDSLIEDREREDEEERTKTVTINIEGIDEEAFLTKRQVRSIVDQINEERESNVRIFI